MSFFRRLFNPYASDEKADKKETVNEQTKPESKEEMTAFLTQHRIALWDVFKSAVRKGSGDESIDEKKNNTGYNNIACFLCNHRSITKILVAGKKAQQGFEEHNKCIKYIPVPSTSGANAHFDENKWREAIDFFLTT